MCMCKSENKTIKMLYKTYALFSKCFFLNHMIALCEEESDI